MGRFNMANNKLDLNPVELYLGEKKLHQNWLALVILGSILVLLGTLAIIGANYATLTSIIFFGSLLGIGGILEIIHAFMGRKEQDFTFTLLTGIIYTIVGLVFVTHPTATALAITLLLAAIYSVTGLFKIIVSVTTPAAQWGWLLFSGIVSLALGLLIWAEWPYIALWLIGLFIGIDLIFMGWFWIMVGLSAKKLPEKP